MSLSLTMYYPMLLRDSTWRIIPISKGLTSMSQHDWLSPLSRGNVLLPNGRNLWLICKWGVILITYKSWDDPPNSTRAYLPRFSVRSLDDHIFLAAKRWWLDLVAPKRPEEELGKVMKGIIFVRSRS